MKSMQTPLEDLLRSRASLLKNKDECHWSYPSIEELLLQAADKIMELRKKALYIETEATDGNGLHICYTCIHEPEPATQEVCKTCLLGEGWEPNEEVSNRLREYINNRMTCKAAYITLQKESSNDNGNYVWEEVE